MSRIKASIVAVLGLYLCGCQDSRSRDAIAVEPNDLGITELEVQHDVVQGERVLTLRGFDRGGATIATAALRTGTVRYGADMPEELHAGTELKVAVNDIDTAFISPDRVAHVIYEPLSPGIGTFVRLHAVASEIDREAGIRFAPPKAPSDEIAFTAGACSGSRFPTNKGGSTQCCQDTTNTYHVNASNAVANRYTYAPAYPSIPTCRKSDGTTGCTTNCLYGPCGSAVGQVAGTNGHVFHPTSDPNVCGWDTGGPGGLGVDYSPEHYTNQTLYGSLTPTCTCNGCNADGTPQCPTIARVNSTKVQAVGSATAVAPALNVSSGNLIVVAISTYGFANANVSSITDTAGNTFQYSGLSQYLANYSGVQRLYYAYNSKANASDVVTVTMTAAPSDLDVVVAQYSGVLATSDPLDVTASAQATNTATLASSSFTPSVTNSLVVGFMTVNWDFSATGPTSFTAGSGYSLAQTVGPNLIDAFIDRVDALASAQTASATEVGATTPFEAGIIVAVFKPAVGAPPTSIARVNSTWVQRTSSTTASTPALTVNSGNLIVVAISTHGSTSNTISSVTDSAGNAFHYSGVSQYIIGFTGIQRLYYAYNSIANANDVVTVTVAQSASYLDVVVAQYSGVLATSDPLDLTAWGQANNTASIATFSFTPSNANSLVVGLMTVNYWAYAPTNFAGGSGYLIRQMVGGAIKDGYIDRVDAPASAQTASGSESGAQNFQNGIIAVVFKPAGAPPPTGIARVNSASVQRANSTSAATPALTVNSGNLIVVAISTYGSSSITVSSITDTAGNTFLNSGLSQNLSGFTGIQRLYYAYNSNANANDVVTVNVSQSAGYLDVVVAQYSGVRTASNPLDVTASAQVTNTTSVTSSSFTPSIANSLAVALVTVNWSAFGPTSISAGSGYTLVQNLGATLKEAYEDRLAAPASAQTASGSEVGATATYQMGIITVVFKPI